MSGQVSCQTSCQTSWDPVWEGLFAAQEWGKYPAESLIRFVARHFYAEDRAATRILEVGCGPGANIWYLAREGFAAYGMDGSASALATARARLQHEGLTAELQCGDILSLPYPDAFFDAVLDAECLYANNYAATRRILAEIRRVLKPQGRLYSRTFSEQTTLGCPRTESLEYKSVPSGPMAGKGFVRLSTEASIHALYGEFFMLSGIEEYNHTAQDKAFFVGEYCISALRKG